MTTLEISNEGFNEVIKNTTEAGFRESIEVDAWINLIKDSGGTVRFRISDAMNVYRARVAIANGDDRYN